MKIKMTDGHDIEAREAYRVPVCGKLMLIMFGCAPSIRLWADDRVCVKYEADSDELTGIIDLTDAGELVESLDDIPIFFM